MLRRGLVFALGSAAMVAAVASPVGADQPVVKEKPTVSKPHSNEAEANDKDAPAKRAKRELTAEQVQLRDRVRPVLAAYQKPILSTAQNGPTEIMSLCLAFGCDSEVVLDGPDGGRLNGITCLCWGYPCAGYELLGYDGKFIAAKVGYGYQEHPGQFLAVLALSRVQPAYPLRVGKDVRKVADLVEAEKLSCRSGSDLSLRLIGLSYYVDQPEWKNDLGETWSLPRMMEEELGQPIATAHEGGLNRLMGLSYAVIRRAKRGQSIDGQFERAQKYINEFQAYALKLQNSDGGWGPRFLASRGKSPDTSAELRSTGRVLEWLVLSLPEEQLADARIVNSVALVAELLGNQHWHQTAASTRDIVSTGHALHALALYNQRVFVPVDGSEKPAVQKPATPKPVSENAAEE